MTTVLWDGKSLTADSRSSHFTREDEDIRRTRVGAIDEQKKIFTGFPPKAQFSGEQILAIAGSGARAGIAHAVNAYMKGQDFAALFESAKDIGCTAPAAFAFLVLTDKSLYSVDVAPGKLKVVKKRLQDSLAIGSGAKIAMYLNHQLGVPPMLAVAATGAVDMSTGGAVSSVEVIRDEKGVRLGRLQTRLFTGGEEVVARRVAAAVTAHFAKKPKKIKKVPVDKTKK